MEIDKIAYFTQFQTPKGKNIFTAYIDDLQSQYQEQCSLYSQPWPNQLALLITPISALYV